MSVKKNNIFLILLKFFFSAELVFFAPITEILCFFGWRGYPKKSVCFSKESSNGQVKSMHDFLSRIHTNIYFFTFTNKVAILAIDIGIQRIVHCKSFQNTCILFFFGVDLSCVAKLFSSCGWVSSLDAGGDDGPSPSLSEEANFPANSDYEGEGDHQFPGKTGTVRTWKMMKTKGHAGENCAV